MNRIKRAWRGVKWSVIRRNAGWAGVVFTFFSFLKVLINLTNPEYPTWLLLVTPPATFVSYYAFVVVVGTPYYFIRNIIIGITATG